MDSSSIVVLYLLYYEISLFWKTDPFWSTLLSTTSLKEVLIWNTDFFYLTGKSSMGFFLHSTPKV